LGLARELGDPTPIGILERNLAALHEESSQ
jgi:hypothetical protein